jgi:hypothetical protein
VKAKLAQLLHSPMVSFHPGRERLGVPDLHGVYVIYDPKGRVAHVGRPVRGKRGLYQSSTTTYKAFVIQSLEGKGSVY